MLKKISNSLSTDNSIPIFGYSINEADIASVSFFCVTTLLYKAVSYSPLLYPKSQFTDKAAASVPIPCVSPVQLWNAFQKGMSRVQISLFCILDEQFENRRGQKPTIRTREDQYEG